MYLLQFFFSYETIKYIIMEIVNKNLLWLCLNRYILHLFMDKVWLQTWLQPKTTASLNTHTHTHILLLLLLLLLNVNYDKSTIKLHFLLITSMIAKYLNFYFL